MIKDTPVSEDDKLTEQDREKALPMLARYTGAWNEYNTRIIARHNITQMWFAAMPILLGIAFAYPDSGQDHSLNIRALAAFCVPIINTFHAGLIWMHDAMLANLHVYMIDCELWHNTDHHFPSYHADESRHYLHLRQWQNYSFAVIAVVAALAGLIPTHEIIQPPFHILYSILGLAAPIFYIAAIRGRKIALEKDSHFRRTEDKVKRVMSDVEDALSYIKSRLDDLEKQMQGKPSSQDQA